MATLNMAKRVDPRLGILAVRFVVVGLTLATAAIHALLGGTLFLANAIGYTALAVAMMAPGPISRVRWLVRIALVGFTAATIGGWVLFGARFPLAYLDKAIEVVLIAAVAFELWRYDGGPLGVVRQARYLLGRVAGQQVVRGQR